MMEIRFHGRGGQGAVTSAELLAVAAISEGKYAQSFPSFGPERRGAPVIAFTRIDDKPIRTRFGIYKPDVVVVLDASLLKIADPAKGLKSKGVLVINSAKNLDEIVEEFGYSGIRVATVDATKIANEELGRPITNTTMLGAVVKITGVIKPESMKKPLERRFGKIAEKNLKSFRRAISEVKE
ncbi:MAG: pyruvate ferredoxin oxidoreductase subunit gamma [Candidatus Krumholzibacteria bacterium]|nr:pyruvate ferredoxin oxidoreductase subunit gamma [Candidatus Krumholzibacteria bacterium]